MPCEGQHAMALNNGATLIPQSGATTFAMLSQIPSGTIQAYFVVTLFPAIKTYKTFVSVMEEPQPQQLWHLNSGTCLLSENHATMFVDLDSATQRRWVRSIR
mmetsp:Transcript_58276/g.127450  ORF Transcript_58276/g.127450 Transcript_58276/m.127450 type:complete len:102 (+) Transcript_58276:280-585(+)